MSNLAITNQTVKTFKNQKCDIKVLNILDVFSPLTLDDIMKLLNDSLTLKKLKIPEYKCEMCRKVINDKIIIPAGKNKLRPGTVKPTTKVTTLIKKSCGK